MTFATDAENPQWMTDHPDYPRRQLQRRTWQPLNGAWQFSLDAAGVAEPAQLATLEHTISVPFAPESALSGINDRGYHPSVWYRREVRVERSPGTRVLLHFGAVDHRAAVWVNGALVGTHEGGHTSFSFDITEQLGAGSTHTIDVRADDDPHDLGKPRGKQDWLPEPHSIWYPRTTGIWQTVWLEEVPELRIERLRWQANIERWQIGLGIELAGDVSTGDVVRVRLRHGDTVLADDRYAVTGRELHRTIALADPGIDDARNQLLWSPESPTLIEAEIELMHGDDVVDSIRSYTAMRTIESSRGRILLNKRPYYLRMVLDQGYWAESLMTPPSADAIVHDITLAKEAGFNGVRKHQKIEDPRYLYWADRLGLLVWEEMPSAYRYSERGLRQLTAEWSEAIDRDINHPCIIAWVPYNESWGVPDLPSSAAQRSAVQALYYLTRALDPSRLVIGNDGWELAATDIIAIHDYSADPAGIRARYSDPAGIPLGHGPSGRVTMLEGHPPEGQPVMLTEFGGIAAGGTTEHGTETWGYSVTGNADELRDAFVALLGEVRAVPVFSGYCYTQFADTFQEANGLFTDDRTPKFALEAMRAAVRGETS